MSIKEKELRRKEIKLAKKEWKNSLSKDIINFQKERVQVQALLIDLKTKSKLISTHDIINIEKIEGLQGRPGYYQGQYQGSINLGVSSNLIILN